ncbi:MAG: efflux RND transporter permease subunit [Planctomycetia bacterium]|nr:efflux RND transporter permease subunit [Planctomycetia bacterium]
MLNSIIRFSLHNRLIILILAVLTLGWGIWQAVSLPIDVLPDLNRPRVTVMTEAPGLAPEEVEMLVTMPLENALFGVTGATAIRSSSVVGLSTIVVEFDWNVGTTQSRQAVFERIQRSSDILPSGITPQMTPVASVMGQIMAITVRDESGKTSPLELRTVSDWIVRKRLLAIDGVSEVYVTGGERKTYQVRVRPDDLLRYGIVIEDIEKAIQDGNENVSGGYLTKQGPKRYLVRSIGRMKSADDIRNLVVKGTNNPPVLLYQVADVKEEGAVRVGDASLWVKDENNKVSGSTAVMLTIGKQPSQDTRLLTDHILHEIESIEQSLQKEYPGIKIDSVYQQRTFIDLAIKNVLDALRDGAFLVLLVIAFFLMSLRTTIITIVTIPLSLCVTAIVFARMGLSVNAMTLGGLAVAIGELVDDAIVDVENIFRRLRENAAAPLHESTLKVVWLASTEIRNSIVNGTIITVLVFFPLYFLSGIEGRLFAPLGMAYIISLLSSLLISLTVTPVLSYYLLPSIFKKEQKTNKGIVQKISEGMAGLAIRFSLRFPWLVLGGSTVVTIIFVFVFLHLDRDFIPSFNEGAIQVNMDLMPGNSLETSSEIADRMAQQLTEVDGIDHVVRKTGRSEMDEHAVPVNTSEFICTVSKEKITDFPNIVDRVHKIIGPENFPGTIAFYDQPLQHMINTLRSGSRAKIAIKIRGDDLDLIRKRSNEIEKMLGTIRDIGSPRTLPIQVDLPQIQINLKRDELARYGLLPNDVNRTIGIAMNGSVASTMLEDQRFFDIVVRMNEDYRENLEMLKQMPIRLPNQASDRTPSSLDKNSKNNPIEQRSGLIPLSAVADIETNATGPGQIDHENSRRQVMVQTSPTKRGAVEVKNDIDSVLKPKWDHLTEGGIDIKITGLFESEQSASRLLAALSILALLGVFLILYHIFSSCSLALEVMAILPLALVGAVAALWLTGQPRTIPALVGMISLCGIASRNGILLMNHYFHLVEFEGESMDKNMIIRAGKDRVAPVLMTALTSAIGLLPLALSPHLPGRELLYPIAVVVIGGLATSTVMEFFVRPALFWTFGRKKAELLIRQRKESQNDELQNVH